MEETIWKKEMEAGMERGGERRKDEKINKRKYKEKAAIDTDR